MKIGLIFECGPAGADKKVCEYLARRLKPEIDISSVTLDNKPGLIEGCGLAAAELLQEGCERVVIVWDLYPPWREKGQRPCRKEDREAIFNALQEAGLTTRNIYLVCIREELEAWLIADGRALSALLSTPAHAVRVKDKKKPERVKNPKMRLTKIFQEHTGQLYNDMIHAERVVQKIEDFTRLRRSPTFVRFARKAADTEI